MANEIKKNAAAAAASSNAGLLQVLNLAVETVEYKTRQQLADEIVAKGNGEIVDFANLKTNCIIKDETVRFKNEENEVEYIRTNIEMPAGALKLIKDDDTYSIARARTSFVASASYSSKMHTDNPKQVLCELVAPGKFSMMSEKLNEEDYIIVLYHIL